MRRELTIAFIVALACSALSGCAPAKWTVDRDVSESSLYWMEAPRLAKLKHVMSIKGFEEANSTFRSFLLGRGKSTLEQPVAFASGSDGRFAIADTGAHCVHYYVPAEQLYKKLSSLESADLQSPVAVAFDEELNLYISDSALGRIFVVDKGGSYLSSITTARGIPLKRPTGLAFDTDNKLLYVTDTLAHTVYAFNNKGEAVSWFGQRGDKEGEFNFPTHLFWSRSGMLYVTDSMNFRIQVFTTSGRLMTSFGHHGDGSGDFSSPKGVAVDKEGVIYVVDALFDNIQLFNERGQFLLTLGRRGVGQGEFWLPSGLYLDEREKLYVSDTFNRRIQVFQIMEDIP